MKIAFHVHSDWSYDGKYSLRYISSLFARRGYDAVLMCEHCRTFDEKRWQDYCQACHEACIGAQLIPGIEYSDPDNIVHLPTWGLRNFVGSHVESNYVITAVKQQNAVCIFAHPSRKNAWSRFNKSWVDVLTGYEAWNRKSDGFAPTSTVRHFREINLKAFAALDYHSDKQRMPFHIEMKYQAHSHGILQAIRKGDVVNRVAGVPLEMLLSSVATPALHALERSKRCLRRRT